MTILEAKEVERNIDIVKRYAKNDLSNVFNFLSKMIDESKNQAPETYVFVCQFAHEYFSKVYENKENL